MSNQSGLNFTFIYIHHNDGRKFRHHANFWEDVHKLAVELWEANKRSEDDISTCPRCGTSRKNWKRWYEGRAFCGFCGLDTDGPDPLTRTIRISKGNYS